MPPRTPAADPAAADPSAPAPRGARGKPGGGGRGLVVGLGHPRCGTGFTAALLADAGLDIAHERPGADGIVSWMALAERVVQPWGNGVGRLAGHRTFLVARSPLAAIPSIVPENQRPRSFGWRAQVLWERAQIDLCSPGHVPQTPVGVAVASYLLWFEQALAHGPAVIFRVDRPQDDAPLAEFLGRPVRRHDGLRSNSRPRLRYEGFEPAQLGELPAGMTARLAALAERLGYPEDAATIRGAAAAGAAQPAAEPPSGKAKRLVRFWEEALAAPEPAVRAPVPAAALPAPADAEMAEAAKPAKAGAGKAKKPAAAPAEAG